MANTTQRMTRGLCPTCSNVFEWPESKKQKLVDTRCPYDNTPLTRSPRGQNVFVSLVKAREEALV